MAVECSSDEYLRSHTDSSAFRCLTRGEAIGLTITVEAGLLSLLAVLFVLSIIAYNVRWRIRHLQSWRVFHQPMDILMASLLVADIVQGIGNVMSLKWVLNGKTEIGGFCTTQGIIKIFGGTAVALSIIGIGIYTFLAVWVGKEVTSMRITTGVVAAIWICIAFLIVAVMTANHNPNLNVMAPVPYWCWLNRKVHYRWRMAVEYLWQWLGLILSVLIYVPLYLWMRGNIVLDETAWWRCHFTFSTEVNPETRATRHKALVMLAYPAVYCAIVPLSVVRWLYFLNINNTPAIHAATLAAVSLYSLSGFLDSILLLKTRPSSGLFGNLMFLTPARPPLYDEESDDVEAVGHNVS